MRKTTLATQSSLNDFPYHSFELKGDSSPIMLRNITDQLMQKAYS